MGTRIDVPSVSRWALCQTHTEFTTLELPAEELVALHGERGDIAHNLVRAGIAPRRLSFTRVLDAVNTAWPRLRAAPSWQEHDEEFERVLDWAAAC